MISREYSNRSTTAKSAAKPLLRHITSATSEKKSSVSLQNKKSANMASFLGGKGGKMEKKKWQQSHTSEMRYFFPKASHFLRESPSLTASITSKEETSEDPWW